MLNEVKGIVIDEGQPQIAVHKKVKLTATQFLFNDVTAEEKNQITWDSPGNHINIPTADGTQASIAFQQFGQQTVIAYMRNKLHAATASVEVVVPTILDACWTDDDGWQMRKAGFGQKLWAYKVCSNIKGEDILLSVYEASTNTLVYQNDYKVNQNNGSQTLFGIDEILHKKLKNAKRNANTYKLYFKITPKGYQLNGSENKWPKKETDYLEISGRPEIWNCKFVKGDKITSAGGYTDGDIYFCCNSRNMTGKKVSINFYKERIGPDYHLDTCDIMATVPDTGTIKVKLDFGKIKPLHKQKWDNEAVILYATLTDDTNNIDVDTSENEGNMAKFKLRPDYIRVTPSKTPAPVHTGEGKKYDKKKICGCKDYDLIWGAKVSCAFRKKLVGICEELWGTDKKIEYANTLMACMAVETNQQFMTTKYYYEKYNDKKGHSHKRIKVYTREEVIKDPTIAYNKGAIGLMQFVPASIGQLNETYGLNLDKFKVALLSDLEQLDLLKKHFQYWIKVKGKSNLYVRNSTDIYCIIFCPALMGKNDDDVVYQKGDGNYEANESLDENHDGEIQYREIRFRLTPYIALGLNNKASNFECGAAIEQSGNSDDNNNGVLEWMKNLVDKHIPYSQSGVRNSLSQEGLKTLDCSETVGIYLFKLGVMTTLRAIDTGTMTTQNSFRKTIGSNDVDFVEGSDKKDFKPQRGDIFVWRDGDGHTGIVYQYDEKNDIVTILEAIGKTGAVGESDQVKNGGYSEAGCSRTAKYHRLKGALYGHRGWVGYFRPKNYTKKL